MMINRLALAGGAALGAVAAFGVFWPLNALLWLPHAREEGRAAYIAEQAAADRKVEIERKGDDAKLRGMSDYDLCVDGLRFRRLPVEPCDVLRGLRP